MRRVLVLLLSTGMLGAGVAAADAKPASKAARLHAFRSCTNLLGYAQRNALRVIRESAVRFPVAPMPTPIQEGAGSDGGGGEERSGTVPVAAPVPAAGEDTSQTNVQEAGVDEPDWVKAAGTTLYVARQGRLRALDASVDRPRETGSIAVLRDQQALLGHGDRAHEFPTRGYPLVVFAAQVRGGPP